MPTLSVDTTLLQGFVLGQYGLQYALEHPDKISRLLILNTPLSKSTKLRPELAAYKAPLPFMRPGNVRDCVHCGAGNAHAAMRHSLAEFVAVGGRPLTWPWEASGA